MLQTSAASQKMISAVDAELQLQSSIKFKQGNRENTLLLAEKLRRNWMVQRGKGHMLDFNDQQIAKLKEFFDSLDSDGGGSISIDEIKIPLIGLGLVDSIRELKDLVN